MSNPPAPEIRPRRIDSMVRRGDERRANAKRQACRRKETDVVDTRQVETRAAARWRRKAGGHTHAVVMCKLVKVPNPRGWRRLKSRVCCECSRSMGTTRRRLVDDVIEVLPGASRVLPLSSRGPSKSAASPPTTMTEDSLHTVPRIYGLPTTSRKLRAIPASTIHTPYYLFRTRRRLYFIRAADIPVLVSGDPTRDQRKSSILLKAHLCVNKNYVIRSFSAMFLHGLVFSWNSV